MAINRYVQRTVTPVQFYTPPLDIIAQAVQQKQQRYDAYAALADQLSATQINAKRQDRAKANAIIQGYQQKINDALQRVDGDYSKLGKDLRSISRQVLTDFSPGGRAHAIQQSYQVDVDWFKRNRERLERGEITPQQLQAAYEFWDSQYEGIGEKDPITGTYNIFNPGEINKFVNVNERLLEAAKEVIAEKGRSGQWVNRDGYLWRKSGSEWEIVSPERIQAAIEGKIGSDEELGNYINQMRQFGYDPLTPEIYQNILGQALSTYAYRNIKVVDDIKFDPLYLKGYEHQLANQDRYTEGYLPTQQNNKVDMEAFDETFKGKKPSKLIRVGPSLVPTGLTDKGDIALERILENNKRLQQAYGDLPKELYAKMKERGEFDGLDERAKVDKFRDRLEETLNSVSTFTPVMIRYGRKTMETMNDLVAANAPNLTYSVVTPDGKIEEGLTYDQMIKRTKSGWSRMGVAKQEFQEKLKEGTYSVVGTTTVKSGQKPAQVIQLPDGTLIYAEGYNAYTDKVAEPLLNLVEPMSRPISTEPSVPTVIPGYAVPSEDGNVDVPYVRSVPKRVWRDGQLVDVNLDLEVFIPDSNGPDVVNGQRGRWENQGPLNLNDLQRWLDDLTNTIGFPHKLDNTINN